MKAKFTSIQLGGSPLYRLLFFLLIFISYTGIAYGQTTYDWLDTAPDGNWKQGAGGARWSGGLWDQPPSGNILRFNNNHQLTMTNNVSGTYEQHKITFGSSNTSPRTIGGNIVKLTDYSTVWPWIKNESSAIHTIGFPLIGPTGNYNLELIASVGSLEFTSTIDNNGRNIQIYGNNSAVDAASRYIRLNGVLSGAGLLNVSQFGVIKLNATQTYTGETQIDKGELWVETAGDAIASGSSIYLGNGGQLANVAKLFLSKSDGGASFSRTININNGNASTRFLGGVNTSGTNSFSAAIALTASNPLNLEAVSLGGTTEFSGVISGTGGTITTLGAGTIRFSVANAYTGATLVTSGTLEVAGNLSSSLVTVQNGATLKIIGDVTLPALTIESGGVVTINTGQSLTVTGALANSAGAAGLVVESGASLITNGSVSGSATVKREIAEDNNWHFISSPVSGQNICDGTFAPLPANFNETTGVTYDVYKWSEPVVALNKNWLNIKADDWSVNTTDFGATPQFAPKVGYLVAYSNTFAGSTTKSFAGTLTTGDQSVALTTGGNTWNLIGNPFASAIDWDNAGIVKTGLENGYYYIYNASGAETDKYEYYLDIDHKTAGANGKISAMQGFFVKASGASLPIANAARVHNNNWLKNAETSDLNHLTIKLSNENSSDEAQVLFESVGSITKGWYDADKLFSMNAGIPQVYTLKDTDQKICINSLPLLQSQVTVPLGMFIPSDGNYTIQLTGMETFTTLSGILLEDLKTNTTQNMVQTTAYDFNASTSDNPNRFLLHFAGTNSVGEKAGNNSFHVFTSSNSIIVSDNTGKNEGIVSVYNMMGQLVAASALNGNASCKLNLNVPVGYYLVKVISSDQAYSTKVFINQR